MASGKITALTPAQVNSWPVHVPPSSVSGEKLVYGPTKESKDEVFMELARTRFQQCVDAEDRRRTEMLLDLEFFCGEQWDQKIKARRESGPTPRPCLTINRVPGFVKHVSNNMRQSRPAIKIDPVGDGADQEDAQIRQGLIRHIEVNSQADVAYDSSFEQMCIMGLGWMRLVDDWDSPTSFDKELFIRWVPNTFAVYSDPFVIQPDWSDMKYAFVVSDMTIAEYKAKFGEGHQATSANNYQSIGDQAKHWILGQKIRVAEYFHVEEEDDTVFEVTAPNITQISGEDETHKLLLSDLDEDDQFYWRAENDMTGKKPRYPVELPSGITVQRARACIIPQVYWSIIDGFEKLKERKWQGRFIPLIPVIGNQIEKNGEKIIVGMVRYAREPQRLYNYMYSSFVETVALAPKNQWVAAIDQIDEFRDLYERANYDPMAVLPYNPKVFEGQLLPPPQRQSAMVDLSSFVQGLQMADQNLKSVFNIFDASLGQKGPQESGLAINARKIESDTGTYDWGDNFIRALRQVGRYVDDLLEYIYNEPGRIVQILREDQSSDTVTMNKPFQDKEGITKHYDLSNGRFSVVVSTGPSFDTKRKESANAMLEIVKVYPPLMQVAGPQIIREMDWPGKDMIAAQMEKAMPPALQTQDPDKPGPTSAELQQNLAQATQLIQGLTAQLHAATDKNELAFSRDRMKEEFATLRTELTNESNRVIQLLKSGDFQAKFLGDLQSAELQRLQAKVEPILDQPSSDGSTPPPAPVQTGQPILAGQPAGS